MRWRVTWLAMAWLLAWASAAQAGVYYSGEPMADLPSQWRGFLLDQKSLRSVAVAPTAGNPASLFRERYQASAAKLEGLAKTRELNADESADLGALYIRLGQPDKAMSLLRAAQRSHPNHFAIAANLGTAWQLLGNYEQSKQALAEAVRLAPGKYQRAEELHLKLVRLRQQKKGIAELEELFGVRWVDDAGDYTPGKMAAAERKKLPEDAVALTQHLALALPADGLLLWQLAEMANMHGDLATAAAIMDGCISQFGLSQKELLRKRQVTRAAADELARKATGKEGHAEHVSTLKARSKRPLLIKNDLAALPPISATAVNTLPWVVVAETVLGKPFRPQFGEYLKELEGKLVVLTGYMQPLGDDTEVAAFLLIENPVGCWYCEMPEFSQLIYVTLPAGKQASYTRAAVRVTGRLALNRDDPEEFLYTLRDAKVAEID